jgi:hypothetical protein
MALLVGDIVFMAFEGQCFGQTVLFTQYYRCSGVGGAQTSLTQDFTEMFNLINGGGPEDLTTAYKDLFSNEYVLEAVRLQRIKPVRSAFNRFAINAGNGTFDGQTGTAANSVGVTFRTELAGRDQVSTKKLGPVPEEAQLSGLLTDAYKAEVKVFADAVMLDIVLLAAQVTLIPVIFHPTTGLADDFATYEIQDEVRTMSRRVVGRGE